DGAPVTATVGRQCFGDLLLVLPSRQDRDLTHHRRAEVAVRVLDAALGPGRDGLVVLVQMRVEPAKVRERPRVREAKRQRSWLAAVAVRSWEDDVQALVAGRIERIVADDRVVIGVVVHPLHRLAGADREGERKESILLRDDHHPVYPAGAEAWSRE